MAHDRDHDHHHAPVPVPKTEPVESKTCPDRKRREHPTVIPREPVDPRVHPTRALRLDARARPARA